MRSALFTPATSPERVAKLPGLGADAGIIDLEDAVPTDRKREARALAHAVAEEVTASAPTFRLFVRVNPIDSKWFENDVAEALTSGLAGVFIPKVESPMEIKAARTALDSAGFGAFEIVAGIESGRGVLEARAITDSGALSGVYFGAEDFVADIGGVRTSDGLEVLYARSHVALAASVGGLSALDEIVADYQDDARFTADATFGRSLGYTGKLCIHPRQVELTNAAFTPSEEEIAQARRIVEAYRSAEREGIGAISVDGAMVDEPMVRRAHDVLRAAGESN